MPSARLPQIALCLAIFCVAPPSGHALQLGETRAQLVAQHGSPGAEDHARNLAMYFWEGWSAQVEFQGDKINKLTYRRNWYLQDQEILSLLQANGGANRWRETSAPNSPNRQWARDDGAYASCARAKPVTIVFESGLVFADTPVGAAPSAVATPGPAYTRIPTFPTPLGAVPEPDLPVADAPPAPAVLNDAPRPVPQLPAEEIAPAAASPTTFPPELSGEAAQAPEPAPAAPLAALTPPPTHGLAYAFAALALLILGGVGAYSFKRRSRSPGKPVAAVRKTASVPRSASALSGVSALRADQFELLVAEIFRRQGYTVELSAGMGSEDGIDLTLRRDSETILVQCKYWKTLEVGIGEIGEFSAAMISCGAPRGVLVTTGEFTAAARVLAAGRGIDLMDGAALTASIAATAKPGEDLGIVSNWIEEFVAHARIFDPECPVCHGTMVIRHNRASGAPSWACRGYPRCPGRREPRLDLLPAPASR